MKDNRKLVSGRVCVLVSGDIEAFIERLRLTKEDIIKAFPEAGEHKITVSATDHEGLVALNYLHFVSYDEVGHGDEYLTP